VNDSDKVIVDDWAWMGWQKLPAHVRTDIVSTLAPLAEQPPDRWPKERIERWRSEPNLYVLPVWVGPNELLAFFYPQEGRIHIDSMFYRELLERLARPTEAKTP
jgi:hypothetical protein